MPANQAQRKAVKQAPSSRVGRPAASVNPNIEKNYQRIIRQKIEKKKRYPRNAKRRRDEGIVKVAFTISKNGTLSKLRIHQSSGVQSLDKAALSAVKKVGRFPPIPPALNKNFINYIIPIAYRLR